MRVAVGPEPEPLEVEVEVELEELVLEPLALARFAPLGAVTVTVGHVPWPDCVTSVIAN